jgi:hypothetical protein
MRIIPIPREYIESSDSAIIINSIIGRPKITYLYFLFILDRKMYINNYKKTPILKNNADNS